jgi:hypothetical protein
MINMNVKEIKISNLFYFISCFDFSKGLLNLDNNFVKYGQIFIRLN